MAIEPLTASLFLASVVAEIGFGIFDRIEKGKLKQEAIKGSILEDYYNNIYTNKKYKLAKENYRLAEEKQNKEYELAVKELKLAEKNISQGVGNTPNKEDDRLINMIKYRSLF